MIKRSFIFYPQWPRHHSPTNIVISINPAIYFVTSRAAPNCLGHSCPCLPSLSFSAFWRHYPRQEPYAVVPHVRICAGGVGQPAFLPRPWADTKGWGARVRCRADVSLILRYLKEMKFFSQGQSILDIYLRLRIRCSYDRGAVQFSGLG